MIPRMRFSLEILAVGLIALLTAGPVWAQINPQARVVRLSFIEGDVTVQRPDVQAWAQAPVNTPLQEGFKLSTGDSSFAEIQLENGGTIRMGELSLLDLTVLERAPNGGTINHLGLRQGYATFHPLPSPLAAALQVSTPYGTIIAQGGAEFRVDLDHEALRVEVFDGSVEVQSNLGAMTIERDSVFVMQPGTSEPTVVSQGITKDDWDNWVDDREARLQSPPGAPSPNNYSGDAGEITYGWNDLSQYGNWSDVPGEGYGWAPTMVATDWAPYSTGQWCWYPGFGYTWIGAESWGWLPYHYGAWDFIPGRGWVWFPGSLRTWSPAQVTWFSGANWVGWAPRHQKEGAIACGSNCGGGVVSASTFRNGGGLTPNLMLGFSPTTGVRVREPGIPPTMAVKVTGPESPSRAAWPAHAAIVYDAQQHRFVNSNRVTPPQPPASTTEANTTEATKPGLVQPVPVGGREQAGRQVENQGYGQPVPIEGREREGRTLENPGYGQPNPAMGTNSAKPVPSTPHGNANAYAAPVSHGNASAKPAPVGSYGNPSEGRMGGGEAGGSHGGGGGGSAGGGHH